MQLAPTGGQIWNWCKWRHLVDNFVTYASGAIRWQTFQLAQVVSSGGQKAFQGNVTMQVTWNVTQWPNFEPICNKSENASLNENIARGTTDPGIASITWFISPATKQANSVERKIQVKHSIGSNFGQMTLPALVLNLPTRWRHMKIQIEHSIGSNFGH